LVFLKLCTGSEDFKQVEALEDKKLEIAQFRAVLNLFKVYTPDCCKPNF